MNDWLALIKVVADVLIIPLAAMIWSVQGRLSKIEGRLETITQIVLRSKDRE